VNREASSRTDGSSETIAYEPPALVVIGPIEAITLATTGAKADGTKPKP
jgi:hypothetical protein